MIEETLQTKPEQRTTFLNSTLALNLTFTEEKNIFEWHML